MRETKQKEREQIWRTNKWKNNYANCADVEMKDHMCTDCTYTHTQIFVSTHTR